jgi:hypothetical protein
MIKNKLKKRHGVKGTSPEPEFLSGEPENFFQKTLKSGRPLYKIVTQGYQYFKIYL